MIEHSLDKNGATIRGCIFYSILLAALGYVAVDSSLGWADSKPKIDVRAQQIESMQARITTLEDRIDVLERGGLDLVGENPGVVGNYSILEARVAALEQQLKRPCTPEDQ